MKKTYVTTMPDHVGAFLKASRCMAALGLNITRVSYNKAIDIHTLFIEADGEPERLALATEELRKIGYLQSGGAPSVLLVEFKLRDRPWSSSPSTTSTSPTSAPRRTAAAGSNSRSASL